MFRFILFFGLFCIRPESAISQSVGQGIVSLKLSEEKLKSLIDRMAQTKDVKIKNELNNELISSFEEILQTEEALSFPFSSLYAISDISTAKKDFRVITWELENEKSEVKYYGIISYLIDNQIYTTVLFDSSEFISNAEYIKLAPNRWYGSLYYDIKKYKHRKQEWVVLLGINRNEVLVKKKVIEPIVVDDNLIFGAEVFDVQKKTNLNRKIYTYAVEADMSIWFDSEEERILLDHLSPLSTMHEGKPEYYVPDLSFDSFTFSKGKFKYNGDVDARMEKNLKDRYFEMELPKQKKVY